MNKNDEKGCIFDTGTLHSLFVSYNRIHDFHDDVYNLATQLCILAEYMYDKESIYDHSAILVSTRKLIEELYKNIKQEKEMFNHAYAIQKQIKY